MTGSLNVPQDICEWVATDTLESWTRDEVNNLNGKGGIPDLPKMLLGLLSFAYVRGVFDSEEILRLCESDAAYRSMTGQMPFSLEQLLAVRHRDRGLLVTLTVRLLTRAVAQRMQVPAASLPPEVKRRLHENAVDRLDNARHMDRSDT